jgi:signal transduction histidine kinase
MREDTTWDEEKRSEFLQIIDDESDRLRELIDNLLDSSRLESGSLSMTLEPARLGPILRGSVQRIQSAHPDLPVTLIIPDDLPIQRIDSTRIAQVVDNFLNNAQKYAAGSKISVQATIKEDNVLVEVIDEGPGIDPEHTPHLFERFYRVPQQTSHRGTGLGLYICRKIIEAHSGEIGVESRPGEGTRFYFSLPLNFEGDLEDEEYDDVRF